MSQRDKTSEPLPAPDTSGRSLPELAIREGDLLWTPSPEQVADAQVSDFIRWLIDHRGLRFDDYAALWRWSVSDLSAFWGALWEHFDIISDHPPATILAGDGMADARWFEGSQLNYAEHVLRYEARAQPGEVAFHHLTETRELKELTWHDLGDAVRSLATHLRGLGVGPGDRVVSYLPNVPETAIAMLATTAIGAVWSAAAPEFGARTVIERFAQIEPKLAFVTDGYTFNGRLIDRRAEVRAIVAALPSLTGLITLPVLGLEPDFGGTDLPVTHFGRLLDGEPMSRRDFRYERVAPDHPLWVLFSSGTTGLPKAIVHGHAGVLMEQLKTMTFHFDMRPGQRLFFYTTTGWMMWNTVISALLTGASAVLYDGSPVHGGIDFIWRMAAQTQASLIGASPTLVQNMKAAGIRPKDSYDLSALRTILLGGAPATPETFSWFYENVREDLWVTSPSGGTEVCSAMVLGIPTQPVYAGEIQCRGLGMDVHVFNDDGTEVIDETGEFVVTSPMPSAPLRLWGDADGSRYHDSYYATFPGVWRHGDRAKINRRGGVYVYGRSDSTLNRFGVRIGSAEIYRTVEQLEAVTDSLIICCETTGGGYYMPLFVTLAEGLELDDALADAIRAKLRHDASPRHVPDEIHHAPGIPYTITGKKMEVPIRRLVMGEPADRVVSRDTMARPALLDWYLDFAARVEVATHRGVVSRS